MKDAEIQNYLRDNGYPEHVVRDGRAGLVRKWREFVMQVEKGYPLGLEDYRNDLDLRAIIQLAGAEDEEIRALDQRFEKMLTHRTVRVWESAANDPFWDFGYPKHLGEDLAHDLRDEGFLS